MGGIVSKCRSWILICVFVLLQVGISHQKSALDEKSGLCALSFPYQVLPLTKNRIL